MNDPREYLERMLPGHNLDEYWRMHYAGQAMQGMCSRHANCDHPDVIPKITSSAFEIADAMIKQSKVSHD